MLLLGWGHGDRRTDQITCLNVVLTVEEAPGHSLDLLTTQDHAYSSRGISRFRIHMWRQQSYLARLYVSN
jgi:hypothetical protein